MLDVSIIIRYPYGNFKGIQEIILKNNYIISVRIYYEPDPNRKIEPVLKPISMMGYMLP